VAEILQESSGAMESWVGESFGEAVGGICLFAHFSEDAGAGKDTHYSNLIHRLASFSP